MKEGAPQEWVGGYQQDGEWGVRARGTGPQGKGVALLRDCQWELGAYGPSAIYRFPSAQGDMLAGRNVMQEPDQPGCFLWAWTTCPQLK